MDDLEGLRRFDVADRVSNTIDNVLSKLKHRNKRLLVADSSSGGWLTVSEYEKPLLGSDSDDERLLRQAEARAVKKIKSSCSKSDSNVFHPFKRTSSFVPKATGRSTPQSQVMPQRWGSGAQQSFRDFRPRTGRDIICFSCGRRRWHIRSECRVSDAFLRSPSTHGVQQDSRGSTAANK